MRDINKSGNGNGPRPLRDGEHLMGLPNLTQSEQIELETANTVFRHVCKIMQVAISSGVMLSFENPRLSRVFLTDEVKQTMNMSFLMY